MNIQQREILKFKKIGKSKPLIIKIWNNLEFDVWMILEDEAEDIVKGAEALPDNWRVVQV